MSDSSESPQRALPRARRNLWPLWAVLAVTLAPVIASYIMYYGVKPEGRVNYGDFVEPQVTLNSLPVKTIVKPRSESAFLAVLESAQASRKDLSELGDWSGRWLMVRVGPAACNDACKQELWLMRQIRLTTGRERDRVERIWILTGDGNPAESLLAEHEGLWVVRLGSRPKNEQLIENWLSVASRGGSGASNIWVVDPLGNLMMRFPDNPDPNGMKKDMNRLLKASRIG